MLRSRTDDADLCNQKVTVYTLPIELLSLIFEECFRDLHQPTHRTRCSLVLSHITKHFRDVALGTPSLWTQIELRVGRYSDLVRADAFLQRSINRLLDVHLYFEEHPSDLSDSVSDPTCSLRMVFPHIHRWHELHLIGSGSLASHTPLAACLYRLRSAEAPNLLLLRIDLANSDVVTLEFRKDVLFGAGAPRLSSIQLCGVAPQRCLPPLASARHLKLQELTPEGGHYFEPFSTLRNLPYLTHLNIDDSFCLDWSSRATIHFPALLTLAICVEDDDELIPGILTALTAPLLQTLILEEVVQVDLQNLFATLDLSQPPKFPSLRSLTMAKQSGHFSMELWDQLTIFLPRVTSFTLVYLRGHMGGSSMAELGHLALTGWPRLHTFTLYDAKPSTERTRLIAPMLLQFLGNRQKLGYPIMELQTSRTIFDTVDQCGELLDLAHSYLGPDFYPDDPASRLVDKMWLEPVSLTIFSSLIPLTANSLQLADR